MCVCVCECESKRERKKQKEKKGEREREWYVAACFDGHNPSVRSEGLKHYGAMVLILVALVPNELGQIFERQRYT